MRRARAFWRSKVQVYNIEHKLSMNSFDFPKLFLNALLCRKWSTLGPLSMISTYPQPVFRN